MVASMPTRTIPSFKKSGIDLYITVAEYTIKPAAHKIFPATTKAVLVSSKTRKRTKQQLEAIRNTEPTI